MTAFPPIELLPGDCLLYRPCSFMGYVICVKTWSHVCHVEVYAGADKSFASRDGKGVNLYPIRQAQLAAVLRPKAKPDVEAARHWFYRRASGQKYDWLGLLCFTLAVKRGSPNKQFCSEFATRWYRNAGVDAFHPHWDADKVAPGNFLMSPAFNWIYLAK